MLYTQWIIVSVGFDELGAWAYLFVYLFVCLSPELKHSHRATTDVHKTDISIPTHMNLELMYMYLYYTALVRYWPWADVTYDM